MLRLTYEIFLSLTILGLISFQVNASEVDSFHRRNDNLKDSTDQINLFSNLLFSNALENANAKADNCDEKILYKNLREKFRNLRHHSKFNEYISYSSELDRVTTSTANSIYGDFSILDSFVLGFYSRFGTDPLASALNIRGHFVGTDNVLDILNITT